MTMVAFLYVLAYLFAGLLDIIAAIGIGISISEQAIGRRIFINENDSMEMGIFEWLAFFGIIVLWPITSLVIVLRAIFEPEVFCAIVEN